MPARSAGQSAPSHSRVKVVRVLVAYQSLAKMCAAIENPAKCEVRAVIRFFTGKQYSAAAIHRELCAGYGPNIMSERCSGMGALI